MLTGSVDTNVLVRLVAQDDEAQAQAMDRLLAKYARNGDLLFVPITVVLELEWVLRSRLGQSKAQFIEVLSALLSKRPGQRCWFEFLFRRSAGPDQSKQTAAQTQSLIWTESVAAFYEHFMLFCGVLIEVSAIDLVVLLLKRPRSG